jgi:hypothetical protein
MAIDTTSLRSRRALLTGGLGALAATVAGALGRPLPALAEGENVKVGGHYPTATRATIVENRTNAKNVLVARSLSRGIGVLGHGLVGVRGTSTRARLGTGVDPNEFEVGAGVRGDSPKGAGVFGVSSSGFGVAGVSTSGIGVRAFSQSNIGILAESSGGYALQTLGRIKISTSGVARIPAGSTSTKVFQGGASGTDFFVLLTAHVDIGARRLWYTLNAADASVTIQMSSVRT